MKIRYLISLTLILSSCQKETQTKEEENTYQIITYLTEDAKRFLNTPPALSKPPTPNSESNQTHEMTCKDSVRAYTYYYDQLTKKKTIAITPELLGIEETFDFGDKCDWVDAKLLEKFKALNQRKKIDVSRITIHNSDTIIPYKEVVKQLPLKGYETMDLHLNFSRIAFNDDFDQAILILGIYKGYLNGVSLLVYLEKENYVWKIICKKGLSIS